RWSSPPRWHVSSSRQPAHIRTASRYGRVTVPTRVGVPTSASGAIRLRSCCCEPRNWPTAETRTTPPTPDREKTEKNSSGACGASFCQAASARGSCDAGQSTTKVETVETGWTRNVQRVTTPKLPPPPPRHAQKRSECRLELQTSFWP